MSKSEFAMVICSCGWSKVSEKVDYCTLRQSAAASAVNHRIKHRRKGEQVKIYLGISYDIKTQQQDGSPLINLHIRHVDKLDNEQSLVHFNDGEFVSTNTNGDIYENA